MSDKNKQTSAVEKAAEVFEKSKADFSTAEIAKNDALVAYTNLTDSATEEQRTIAEKLMNDTRVAFEKAEKSHNKLVEERETGKTKKVKILLPVAGLFFLPYNVGQEVELPENQADELIDAKYAELVK